MTGSIEEIVGLSPAQQGMLVHAATQAEGSDLYLVQLHYVLQGDLDLRAMRQAWQELIRRHVALRTSFHWEDLPAPVQVIHTDVELPMQELDWRGLASAEQEARLAAFLAKDRQTGFDPTVAPLMRLTLIRVGENSFHYIWTQHHILLDGWSLGILLGEMLDLYEAAASGRPVALPEPSSFLTYLAWLEQQDAAEADHFWRQALAGFEQPTRLRVERSRAGAPQGRMAYELRWLRGDQAESLRQLARRAGVTFNTLIQAAWAILLSRYAGERDVLFGATVSGRPASLPGAQSMVGLFINTLPVRVMVDPDAPLQQFLHQLQASQAAARQFEHVPLSQIQRCSEVQPGMPLFHSIVVFENFPVDGNLQLRGAELGVRDAKGTVRTNYPLTLVVEPGAEVQLRLEYDDAWFDQDRVVAIIDQLCHLLLGMVDGFDGSVGALPLLPDAERQRLLVDWNQTARPIPALPAHQLIEEQALRTPDRLAVTDGVDSLTYRQLDQRANALAATIQQMGVGPETVVALLMERSTAAVVAMLAVWKAGGAYLPLDPGAPTERLAWMLRDSGAHLLLTTGALGAELPVSALVVDVKRLGEQESPPATPVGPANLAYVIYTSGSTGLPKGVMIEHQGLVNYLTWAGEYYRPDPAKSAPVHSPLSFDLTITSLFVPLTQGGSVVLVPEADGVMGLPERLAQSPGYSLVKLTPAHMTVLNGIVPPTRAAQSTDLFVIGGEALLQEQLAHWRTWAPATRLVNEYGPTETVVGCAIYEVGTADPLTGAVPIGRPIQNTRLYVLDESMQPVPTGVPGELYIGGLGVGRGYLGRPDLTADRFPADPFSKEPGARLYRTGDLVRYRPDGNLEYLGRLDHQVKLRGYRIELGEIEAALVSHPAVAEAVLLLRQEGEEGPRLVAYVVPRGADPSVEELRAHLATRLPAYMIPHHFVALAALPLTRNGKVDRGALPDPQAPPAAPVEALPSTPAEEILAAIWRDLLRLESVSVHANFFALGGDSILGIQVVARANRAGLKLSPTLLFEHPTIAELATLAVPAGGDMEGTPPEGAVPLTPIQRWFLEQEPAEPFHFNQSVLVAPVDELDLTVLESAVAAVVAQHDALRLRFWREGGAWKQAYAALELSPLVMRIDLDEVPGASRSERLQRALTSVQRSLNLQEGPLLRLGWVTDGSDSYLLIAIHHLVVDGLSWRLLLEDLNTAYVALAMGARPVLPPKTASYKAWAEGLVESVEAGCWDEDLAYYRQQGRALAAQASQPSLLERSTGDLTEGGRATVRRSLPAHLTAKLLTIGPQEHLLAALVEACQARTGQRRLLVGMEGHGREELVPGLDTSRTVGWFTSHFPLLLDLTTGDPVQGARSALAAIPHRGATYGLLRYLGPEAARAELAAQPTPEIAFNYLGQYDQVVGNVQGFRVVNEEHGATRSPLSRPTAPLTVDLWVLAGELHLLLAYGPAQLSPAAAEALADRFMDALQRLMGGAGQGAQAPSTDSDDDELAAIMAKLSNV